MSHVIFGTYVYLKNYSSEIQNWAAYIFSGNLSPACSQPNFKVPRQDLEGDYRPQIKGTFPPLTPLNMPRVGASCPRSQLTGEARVFQECSQLTAR